MVTDLVADPAPVALGPGSRRWRPPWPRLGRCSPGFSAGGAPFVLRGGWWIHLVDLLFFANYLPYSKHFHIIMAVPNIFLMKLDPMGRLGTPDLENRSGSAFRGSRTSPGSRCWTATRAPSAAAAARSARRRSRASRSTRSVFIARCGTPCTRRRRTSSPRRPAAERREERARGKTSSAAGSPRTRSGPARPAAPARPRARSSSSPGQDLRHPPQPRAREGRVPDGDADRLPRHGDERQPWAIAAATRADWAKDLPS